MIKEFIDESENPEDIPMRSVIGGLFGGMCIMFDAMVGNSALNIDMNYEDLDTKFKQL